MPRTYPRMVRGDGGTVAVTPAISDSVGYDAWASLIYAPLAALIEAAE